MEEVPVVPAENVQVVPLEQEKVQIVPQEENTFFYENISLLKDDALQTNEYSAEWIPFGSYRSFIYLNRKNSIYSAQGKIPHLDRGDQDHGWKLHIRADATQDDDNLRKAWNAVVNVFIEHKIIRSKVITEAVRQEFLQPDSKMNEAANLGKEITVYVFKNVEKTKGEWYQFVVAVEHALENAEIRPSEINRKDECINGSRYLCIRDDTPDGHPKKPNPLDGVEIVQANEVNVPIGCSPCCKRLMRNV